MALAWNAGWVNSPGVQIPILRTLVPGVRPGCTARSHPAAQSCKEWHADPRREGTAPALFLIGVVLYVVFVPPRWWVLTGDIPSTLATARPDRGRHPDRRGGVAGVADPVDGIAQ